MIDQVLPAARDPTQQRSGVCDRARDLIQPTLLSQKTRALHQADDRVQVTVDAGRFLREAIFQSGGEVRLAFRKIEALLADEDVIVTIGIEFAEFQILRHAQPFVNAAQRSAGLHLADVVHAGAEAIALQRERVRPAAGHFVLFADQHALSRLRERHGSGQAARARTNDDHVIVSVNHACFSCMLASSLSDLRNSISSQTAPCKDIHASQFCRIRLGRVCSQI